MEEKEHPFAFSVVMAVYNVELFLREAVDSLIAQDFGFENIQLIMVDDGSTDGSGAICDEYAEQYPDNVRVIHKENGGVASARNEGLKYASGRYLNFMDSDDKFTENTFRKVYEFFTEHEEETDIVTVPLRFFDGLNEDHWQNGKFRKGSRVLDLYWDYQATLMFVNASFFAASVKDNILFDSRLVCGEDMKVILEILSEKMKMGVVTGCNYMYRRRTTGESLIQLKEKKHGWYFDYFTYLIDWAVEFYQNKFGFLPSFLQYELMCDIQWRFGQVYDMTEALSDEEIEQYKARLFSSLRYFEDKYILEQKMIWDEHKCYMLEKKYGHPATLTERYSNVIVHFGDTKLNSFADQFNRIEFITIDHQTLIIEGFMKVFGVKFDTPLEPYVKVNDELIPCEILEREDINEYRFEELMFRGIAFRAKVPLNASCQKYEIQFVLRYGNSYVVRRDLRFGKFAPIGREYSNAYFYDNNWVTQVKNHTLEVTYSGKRGHFGYEYRFLKELWKKNRLGARKAVIARILYYLLLMFKRKEIWLISDRPMTGGDNGEAFFRYMREQHPENSGIYFIISKQSSDYERMKKTGPVVNTMSFKHKLLHLLCDYNISSQFDDTTVNPFWGHSAGYRDILIRSKFVFLQHGVIHDDLSRWLNRYNQNIYGFVTTAKREYESILEGEYSYGPGEVWLTGLPRFDRLYRSEKNIITVMPTWRLYLMSSDKDGKTGKRKLSKKFTESEYFLFYQGLLNHPRLIKAAEENGYEIMFFPHPELQPYIPLLSEKATIKCFEAGTAYRDIYAWSNLVITDYSSACFDFVKLHKPIVYCQFDKEKFFSGGHVRTPGYFDYERDGFGEVEYTLEGTVDRIIEYMENNCQLKDKYRERIDGFFAFDDKDNCRRVYEKILEMEKQT